MRITLVATAFTLSVVGLSIAADSEAAIRRHTNIPAQELGSALRSLAKERNFQIVYATQDVAARQTMGAVGDLSAAEALQQLLEDTGLTFRHLDEKTITVISISAAQGSVSSGENIAGAGENLSRHDQEPQGDRKKSFWDRFRVAQVDQGKTAGDGPVERSDSSSSGRIAESAEFAKVQLEEIIVTAQKRSERLIDTPQSVTVLSADSLAKLGATQFRDFANTVPGLTFTTSGAGATQVSLRGVTVGLDVGPTVGVYVDDVPYGSSSGFAAAGGLALDVGLFDVDRIEVLRGPQGTLYGASTMGGLLKYVSRRPNMEAFGADLQVGTSSTRDGGVSYDGAAVINAPIVADTAALRVTGFYSHDGGYIDNVALDRDDVNRADISGGRADLLFTPTDAFTLRVTGFLQNISRDGDAAADYSFTGEPLDGSLEQRRLFPERFDQHFRLVSATADYDFGPTTLTAISSYQTTRVLWDEDLSAAFVPFLNSFGFGPYSVAGYPQELSTDKFTQEVRLSANGSQRLEWLIGGFYTQETSGNEQEFALFDLAGQPATNDLLAYSAPSRYDEYAAFGDLTYHFTSTFDVSAGLRYAHNRQRFTQDASGAFAAPTPTGRSSEDVLTYLANARYRFNDRAIGYLRFATGYRPGGPNFLINDPNTGLPIGPPTFDSDRLKSYEAGFKSETTDRRFGIDVAGYYIDWSNIQIVNSLGFGYRDNAAGGASVRGAELTLTARPTDGFTVLGAFAYQDAQMSEDEPVLRADKGERLPNVPRFTASLTADYDLPMGDFRPTVGATLRYVSDRNASFDASTSFPQYRFPEYTTVDLRTGAALGAINVQLYVHNLFDKRGQLSAVTNFGPPQVSALQPRTVGISASTRF